jgi:hypothetical protein
LYHFFFVLWPAVMLQQVFHYLPKVCYKTANK